MLTQHSVDRPWILYEAGVAKGKLETPLLGVAIGIPLNKANNGPFAQFQNSGDDVDSLTKLVVQLVKRIPNAEPDKDVIKMQVEAFKISAAEILAKEPEKDNKEGELMEDSTVAKLFEEIKIMYQDLPSRIASRSEKRLFKGRKFHPMMLDELMHESRKYGNKYLGFLIWLSIFKDDFPWIYEIGKETYETIKSKKAKETKRKALNEFRKILELTMEHPVFRHSSKYDKDYRMFYREFEHTFLRYIEDFE